VPELRLELGSPALSFTRRLLPTPRGIAYIKDSNVYEEGPFGARRGLRLLSRGFSRVGADRVVERADYTRTKADSDERGSTDSKASVTRYYQHQGGKRTSMSRKDYVEAMKSAPRDGSVPYRDHEGRSVEY
jgi:hypothetical protein